MRRNELAYLQALKSFSVPARAFWKVFWLDGENFEFEFQGSSSMYRYFIEAQVRELNPHLTQQAT